MVAVLGDYLGSDLRRLSLLDVGASTGIIAHYLGRYFGDVVGMDIDRPAIEFAVKHFAGAKLHFVVGDAMNIALTDSSRDVVVCAQVYEHVPDAERLLAEIHRVLRPGGVCYFAAGNRLQLFEPHYRLPLLSVIPRPLAHMIVRAAGKGSCYYEKHLTFWGLRRLVSRFERVDYTLRIIENPRAYRAEYLLPPRSARTSLARLWGRSLYAFFPGYIWLLRKPP
jgi:SAM-dependent methyltransferase